MNAPSLVRKTFKTSRLAEFCSQKELVNQTGHSVEDWPLVVLKELLDNALGGAEEAGIAPVVEIIVGPGGITVTGNGPGLSAETIVDILDYMPVYRPGRPSVRGAGCRSTPFCSMLRQVRILSLHLA